MSTKAVGQRGSWFAKAEGEMLPCVHKHWWSGKTGYFDPGIKPGERNDFVEAIQKKRRVILTDDNLIEGGGFERTKYIAIYDVDNVAIDQSGLRFDFKKRVNELD